MTPTPELIDSGRSEVGWSFYGNYSKCLHYGALIESGIDDHAEPLVCGSLGHTGMAHMMRRWQAKQQKEDPERWYPIEAAMEEWCRRYPHGAQYLGQMIDTVRRYLARNPEPPWRIVGVEMLLRGVIGHRDGHWGLWTIVDDDLWFNRDWRAGQKLPRAVLGGEVTPTCIDMPGSTQHGMPIMLTRRIDMATMDRAGVYHVKDWKFVGGDTGKGKAEKYAMDGQFPATRTLCSQLWDGRWGSVTLGLIQRIKPWAIGHHTVPYTPWRDQFFCRNIYRLAHIIAQLRRDEPDPHAWPFAQHEQVCVSRYGDDGGKCFFYKACMLGPGGLVL